MSHGILVQEKVAAMNIDSLNRSVTSSASQIDNGNIFNLLTRSVSTTSGCEVWVVSAPVTGSLIDLWMAYEPEVVNTISGTKTYRGIDPDPRDFYMASGDIFSAFKPQKGDILLLSADACKGSKADYAVATNGVYQVTFAAAPIDGFTLKLLADSYISLADGSIGTQRVAMYKFEVVSTHVGG